MVEKADIVVTHAPLTVGFAAKFKALAEKQGKQVSSAPNKYKNKRKTMSSV